MVRERVRLNGCAPPGGRARAAQAAYKRTARFPAAAKPPQGTRPYNYPYFPLSGKRSRRILNIFVL